MKFYISAKWQLKDRVIDIQNYLVTNGHEITSKWTERAFARDYEQFKDSEKYSEEEIHSILDSDVLIHLSDLKGVGTYVDLGIALAGNLIYNKPLIYVIGKHCNESQFYFNQRVNRKLTEKPLTESFDKKVLDDILQEVSNK